MARASFFATGCGEIGSVQRAVLTGHFLLQGKSGRGSKREGEGARTRISVNASSGRSCNFAAWCFGITSYFHPKRISKVDVSLDCIYSSNVRAGLKVRRVVTIAGSGITTNSMAFTQRRNVEKGEYVRAVVELERRDVACGLYRPQLSRCTFDLEGYGEGGREPLMILQKTQDAREVGEDIVLAKMESRERACAVGVEIGSLQLVMKWCSSLPFLHKAPHWLQDVLSI